MKFLSNFCALGACLILTQVSWVNCKPQWGVPAAADAANSIDLERYQAQALYHQQFPQQHHQQNHFFPGQQNFHQFPQRFNQAPIPQQQQNVPAQQPLPTVNVPAPVQTPSLTGPYSQTAPKSPPPKGMRRPKRRKLLKKKKKAARKVGQALPPQVPMQPMGNLQNIRGPIMRQDSYPNYYYQGQRGVVPPKPEWGFWKWGKENVASFFG